MHESVLAFTQRVLQEKDIKSRRVLEVGAYNVNGTVRPYIESHQPLSYIGTDMRKGPGVDIQASMEELITVFGPYSFELVICTEVLEHVEHWQEGLQNLIEVARDGGLILITTRSKGFPLHDFPHDYWRFSKEDFKNIFTYQHIEVLEDDPQVPGVFALVRKTYRTTSLKDLKVESV